MTKSPAELRCSLDGIEIGFQSSQQNDFEEQMRFNSSIWSVMILELFE